jgi:hypothetical protein
MRISSIETIAKSSNYSLKISFITAWKVLGAFVGPKGITRNSYDREGTELIPYMKCFFE